MRGMHTCRASNMDSVQVDNQCEHQKADVAHDEGRRALPTDRDPVELVEPEESMDYTKRLMEETNLPDRTCESGAL